MNKANRRALCRKLALICLLVLLWAVPCDRAPHAIAETGLLQQLAAGSLQPALVVVPQPDGQSVLVQAGGVGQLNGQVFSNVRFGPTGNKGSYTMVFSDTIGSYVSTVPGFSTSTLANASLSITTTAGLDSGELVFTRGFVPADDFASMGTDDGGLELLVPNRNSFPGDAYVALAPSYAPPGPPPAGYRLVGRTYSVRASTASAESERPLTLRFAYDPDTLTPSEQASLAVFAWDAAPSQLVWTKLGGLVSTAPPYVSISTRRLTFYALMTAVPESSEEQLFLPLLRSAP